jgi:hypothetical protein
MSIPPPLQTNAAEYGLRSNVNHDNNGLCRHHMKNVFMKCLKVQKLEYSKEIGAIVKSYQRVKLTMLGKRTENCIYISLLISM